MSVEMRLPIHIRNRAEAMQEFRIVGMCPQCMTVVTMSMPLTDEMQHLLGNHVLKGPGNVINEDMLKAFASAWEKHVAEVHP